MIHSMTAYARHEIKAEWGTASWEIRSVNHRFLEANFRLPEAFRGLESVFRERLRQGVERGKVECSLKFALHPGHQADLIVNEALATNILQKAQWLQGLGARDEINAIDILRWPGVLEAEEENLDALQGHLTQLFDQTIDKLKENRHAEGSNLAHAIEERLKGIEEQIVLVLHHMPAAQQWQKERIIQKFTDAKLQMDAERIEQELVLLAQKSDVAEELDRLSSHIKETRKALTKGGPCGRRLDFMMQEFNREANTLGAKSINSVITNAAIELKVLIEQMREQVQNIE